MTRLSRHCYDKSHRCPGWAGGGTRWAKVRRCNNGRIQINYSSRWKNWTFHRCDTCDVLCWPIVVRELDWRWWGWRLGSFRRYWLPEHLLWPVQGFIVVALERVDGWIDKIPTLRHQHLCPVCRGDDVDWNSTSATPDDSIDAWCRRVDGDYCWRGTYVQLRRGWHWTQSQWGCWPLRLASLSNRLDQRWHTRVWEPVPEGEETADGVHGIY